VSTPGESLTDVAAENLTVGVGGKPQVRRSSKAVDLLSYTLGIRGEPRPFRPRTLLQRYMLAQAVVVAPHVEVLAVVQKLADTTLCLLRRAARVRGPLSDFHPPKASEIYIRR
jgi:hypothetical protein